jgi:hypothetical protein
MSRPQNSPMAGPHRTRTVQPCRFDSLREHTPNECPACNPTGWKADPDSAPTGGPR